MKSGKHNSWILLIFLVTSILSLVWLIRDSEFLVALNVPVTQGPNQLSPEARSTQNSAGVTPRLPNAPEVSWLDSINHLRKQSGISAVRENEGWSSACQLHSQYMVKSDTITHIEDPNNPWYTPDGARAAQNSNVMASSDARALDEDAIKLWISQPFHGIGILDPQLETVGFGSYRESSGKWEMAASLDIVSGNTKTELSANTYPVFWPPDGHTTTILSFEGNEWPDPLTSCPGYKTPTGPPIYLQIGAGNLTPQITGSSFQKDEANLEHCIFDETSYINTGPNNEQEIGRDSLDTRDAIILIPREPLKKGAIYTVSITVNDKIYTWSFTAQQ